MESSNYPPTERPDVAVDTVIFTIDAGTLKVLLIVRDHDPFTGMHAIPGAFVLINERLDEAASRVLRDKGGMARISYMEQLYTFGEPNRDPRGRVIGISYLAIVNAGSVHISETISRASWFDVNDLPPLAFDHADILKYAVQRLQWKIEYTTAAFAFLPEEFPLSSVKHVYETILGKEFNKGNFWHRMLAREMLRETGRVEDIPESRRVHRPGKLYRLNRNIGDIIPIF